MIFVLFFQINDILGALSEGNIVTDQIKIGSNEFPDGFNCCSDIYLYMYAPIGARLIHRPTYLFI